jgi:hypothetical protein
VPSKDYIFKRGSISTPIIPHDCFTTVTVELINNYFLLIYAVTDYIYQLKGSFYKECCMIIPLAEIMPRSLIYTGHF